MAITNGHPPAEDRLQEAILLYLKGMDRCAPVEPTELMARYPDVADGLRDFFADQESLQPLLAPLRVRHDRDAGSFVLRPFGKYDLIEEVGRGGMGIVYKARQRGLGRLVALKVIRVGWLATAAEVQRFRNEAETIAALEHPNIVRIYDVDEHDGHLYFTMPWLDAGSLDHARHRLNGDPETAAMVVATAARALHHAHERGVLHRDVKPSNVLLDGEGRVYLADFGLAKRLDVDEKASLTESGAVVGTPGYLSPEQALVGGVEVTTASDVYGLGAVLYCLLTGEPPFSARTPLETLALVRTQDPRPLSSAAGAPVDRDLEAICLKCLEKEPGRRYRSAEALAEDLERWHAGEPVQARRPCRADRLWRWCRRNRALAAMGAFLAILAVGGVASLIAGLAVVNSARQAADRHRATAEERAARLREHLDAANAALGFKLLERDQAVEVGRMLEQFPNDQGSSDFAWNYLRSQVRARPRELTAYRGHRGKIYSAKFSPDGKTVASCGEDRSIQLWDAATGAHRLTLWPDPSAAALPVEGHTNDENCVAFSPDGRTLASAGEDGSVRLWNLETREWSPLLPRAAAEVLSVEFSPDGALVAAAGPDRIIRVWDAKERVLRAELTGHEGLVTRATFRPDGRELLSVDTNAWVKVWDVPGRRLLRSHHVGVGARGLAYAPDGKSFATGHQDGSIRLWRSADGAALGIWGCQAVQVRCVAFSPDGTMLAAGDDQGNLRVGPVAAGGLPCPRIPAHLEFAWCVQFAPDGQRLLSCGSDRIARIFALPAPALSVRADSPDWRATLGIPVSQVAFAPSGSSMALSTTDGRILMGDPSSGQPLSSLPLSAVPGSWVGFSSDGRELVYIDRSFNVNRWLLAEGRTSRVFPARAPSLTSQKRQQKWSDDEFRLSPLRSDGLAILYNDGLVGLRDRGRAREYRLRPKEESRTYTSIAATPDGTMVAVADSSATVTLVAPRTGLPRLRVAESLQACALAFSPAATELAVGCDDGTLRLVDASTGQNRASLVGHSLPITALAYSPDGRIVVSAGRDGSVKLWHVATAQELVTLEARPGPITSIAFSADGRILAVAGSPPSDRASVTVYDSR